MCLGNIINNLFNNLSDNINLFRITFKNSLIFYEINNNQNEIVINNKNYNDYLNIFENIFKNINNNYTCTNLHIEKRRDEDNNIQMDINKINTISYSLNNNIICFYVNYTFKININANYIKLETIIDNKHSNIIKLTLINDVSYNDINCTTTTRLGLCPLDTTEGGTNLITDNVSLIFIKNK